LYIGIYRTPSIKFTTMKFWQDVIMGHKHLMRLDQAPEVTVEKLAEFKVSEALKIVKEGVEGVKYIPDGWFKEKAKIDRKYLWVIINAKHPEYVREITNHAYAQRFIQMDSMQEAAQFMVTQEVADLVNEIPYLPSKWSMQVL